MANRCGRRPITPGQIRSEHVSCRMTVKDKAHLMDVCASLGLSLSDFVTMASHVIQVDDAHRWRMDTSSVPRDPQASARVRDADKRPSV